MPSIVHRGDLGGGRRDRDHLSRRARSASPPELYDAAEVDGASIWQKIWHVTLPQLRGVLFVTLILQLIATAQLFTEPFLFTGGGPANSTMTVLLLIYHYAFQNSLGGDYGMAAALSVMLAAFLAVFTAGYFWLTRSWSTTHERFRRRATAWRSEPRPPTRDRSDRSRTSDWRQPPRPLDDAHRSTPATLFLLLVVGLGPLLWMVKSSITPTQDTLRTPMALWPHGFDLGHIRDAPGRGPTSTATS